MKQFYVDRRFTDKSRELINTIDTICADYMRQGFVLTVRQLYYQLVARNIIENTERSYKNTTNLVNDARLAGLIDWDAIEDRTREFVSRPHWDSASGFLGSVIPQYHSDLWVNQPNRCFVIVEKEALAGVLEGVCRRLDVPLLAARGYPSVSVLRKFAIEQMLPAIAEGQQIAIIHLGDHDPSGIDMTRDLIERIALLSEREQGDFTLERIALNMDQVRKYRCPPNPAKVTDARFESYQREHGSKSWELDALEPRVLVNLVEASVSQFVDDDIMEERKAYIAGEREKLDDAMARIEDTQE